jgi:hypothetical protein
LACADVSSAVALSCSLTAEGHEIAVELIEVLVAFHEKVLDHVFQFTQVRVSREPRSRSSVDHKSVARRT